MAVSGLIITFSPDSGPTLEALRNHPRIQVGDAFDHRLPIVIETSDADDASSMWEWLYSLPGVVFIDVAFLHFDDSPEIQNSVETT